MTALYPLRFEAIYQYRIWGGQRLRHLVNAPLPDGQPIGEAWLLSDRDDHPSIVAEGPLAGQSLRHVLEEFPAQVMGALSGRFARFPLLLKFLDVTGSLSVQVHPSDGATELLPAGDTGKTETWVVLQVGPEARVFAGLKSFTSGAALRQAIAAGRVADDLASRHSVQCWQPHATPRDRMSLGRWSVGECRRRLSVSSGRRTASTGHDWSVLVPAAGSDIRVGNLTAPGLLKT